MSTELIPRVIKGKIDNSYFLFILKPPKTVDYKGKAKIAWLNDEIKEIEMKNLGYVGMDHGSGSSTPDYRYHANNCTILDPDKIEHTKDQKANN